MQRTSPNSPDEKSSKEVFDHSTETKSGRASPANFQASRTASESRHTLISSSRAIGSVFIAKVAQDEGEGIVLHSVISHGLGDGFGVSALSHAHPLWQSHAYAPC